MPVAESTAVITEPVDSSDDGFDMGAVADRMYPDQADQKPVDTETPPAEEPAAPEVPETPDPEEPETPPAAEPVTKGTLDLNAEFAEPVAGKYKTVGEFIKAFENQSKLVGEHATKLESAQAAMALVELAKTDPAAAKAQIDSLARQKAEQTLEEAIEMNADPDAWAEKKFREKQAKFDAERQAIETYTTELKKVYPSWDQMDVSRQAVKQAFESGTLGEPELYQLAALGRAVRDGKLVLPAGVETENTPLINPATAGAGKAPKSPGKAVVADPRDQFINDLDHSGAMV